MKVQEENRSELSFSYRQGVELAIEEFTKDSSLVIDVQFFDSMNQRDTVQGIVQELITNQPDLVLGPMYSSRLMQLKGTPQRIWLSTSSRSRNLFETRVFGMMWFPKMCSGVRLKIFMICCSSKTQRMILLLSFLESY